MKSGHNILIKGNKCYRCSHVWKQNNGDIKPKVCPKCKNPYWDTPKKEAIDNYLNSPSNDVHRVIALGGGTPMNGDLLKRLKDDDGFVVFLKADHNTLFQRLVRNGSSRFLKGENPEQVL